VGKGLHRKGEQKRRKRNSLPMGSIKIMNFIYKFCKGYVIGVCIIGTLFALSFLDWPLQLLFGFALANVGWNWFQRPKKDN
tara:strand:+ start:313 stop:555 length:243 start_codon:yes stop_codon:yes gene_type:complete